MDRTIKQLSKELNCSYEAIRKHTKRYDKELREHVYYVGKTLHLDDYACDFIKNKRVENPVVVQTIERDEQIEALKEQVTLLQAKIVEQAEKIASQSEELREADKQLAEKNVLLLTAEKDKERADVLEARNMELSKDYEALKNRTLWERIRNK